MFVFAIGLLFSLICYTKKKRETAYGVTIEYVEQEEVGGEGATQFPINVDHSQDQIEVELEAMQPEIEVEVTPPEIAVEVKIPAQESLDFQESAIIVENETLNITNPIEQVNTLDLEVAIEIET